MRSPNLAKDEAAPHPWFAPAGAVVGPPLPGSGGMSAPKALRADGGCRTGGAHLGGLGASRALGLQSLGAQAGRGFVPSSRVRSRGYLGMGDSPATGMYDPVSAQDLLVNPHPPSP